MSSYILLPTLSTVLYEFFFRYVHIRITFVHWISHGSILFCLLCIFLIFLKFCLNLPLFPLDLWLHFDLLQVPLDQRTDNSGHLSLTDLIKQDNSKLWQWMVNMFWSCRTKKGYFPIVEKVGIYFDTLHRLLLGIVKIKIFSSYSESKGDI